MVEKHIRFNNNDSRCIELYAIENGMTYNEAVRDLVKLGISESKRLERTIRTEKTIVKIASELDYLIKLLEQLYSDFGIDELTTPSLCDSLNLFKYKYRKNIMDD